MSWTHLTLVTDAELGQLEPEAVAAAAPWGATTWASARTEAKRDLKIWLERDYSKYVPNPADRIRDRWKPEFVFSLTSAAYVDRTTEAADDTEEDLDLSAIFATFGTDRLYVGASYEFEGLFVKLLDSLNANAVTLTAKYWGADGWTSLSATDGTIATATKTLSGSGRITWTLPSAWERRTLNGTADEYFWVELSLSAALSAGVAATQILPLRAQDGLKRVAAYLALAHIFRGLSAAAANPEAWLSRVTNDMKTGYWDQAVDLYASLRDNGGIAIDLNRDDAVDQVERTNYAPLILRRG